jgi:hypothetical protein
LGAGFFFGAGFFAAGLAAPCFGEAVVTAAVRAGLAGPCTLNPWSFGSGGCGGGGGGGSGT